MSGLVDSVDTGYLVNEVVIRRWVPAACARTLLLSPEHFVGVGDTMGDVRARIAESLDELRALDSEMPACTHGGTHPMQLVGTGPQLDLLAGPNRGLIDIVIGETGKIDLTRDAGTVYEECRQADERAPLRA